jgi:NAD(P)-dependent dehydrogenase (short-subunit alcohol dehydrogenase family)
VAAKFLSQGFDVSILSRNQDNVDKSIKWLEELKKQTSAPGTVLGFTCDVSNAEFVSHAMQEVVKASGSVDVLVNAAGVNVDNLLLKASTEEVSSVIQTNLVGTILTCKSVLRQMIRQKKGAIINVGSVVWSKGNVGQTVYSASKSGLVGFTKSLAKEVASKGITVNLIAPGFIDTKLTSDLKEDNLSIKMIPMERMGDPKEVAEAVFFLAISRYITGEVLTVDGGLSLYM